MTGGALQGGLAGAGAGIGVCCEGELAGAGAMGVNLSRGGGAGSRRDEGDESAMARTTAAGRVTEGWGSEDNGAGLGREMPASSTGAEMWAWCVWGCGRQRKYHERIRQKERGKEKKKKRKYKKIRVLWALHYFAH